MAHNKILISIGSNIDREKHTRTGLLSLKCHFANLSCSSVYESEAIGFDGSAFYNWVALAYTDMSVAQVSDTLKQIEREHGRTHTEKKRCSRTLDLDLLTYNQLVCSEPVLLPRAEILYSAFVLKPLAELQPEEVHPVTGQSYRQLWQQFNDTGQPLWPANFTWREV